VTAEDAAKEACLGVLRDRPSIEGRSSLRDWIFTIVVNRANPPRARGAQHPFSAPAPDETEGDDPTRSPEGAKSGHGIGATDLSHEATNQKNGCSAGNSARASMRPLRQPVSRPYSCRCRSRNR
jgi:DNA-directed RNA polymerase specialized sigma24 family protein